MKGENKAKEIVELLRALNAVYPEYALTPNAVHLYFEILKDEPLESLKKRTMEIMRLNMTFPKPCELLPGAIEPQEVQ